MNVSEHLLLPPLNLLTYLTLLFLDLLFPELIAPYLLLPHVLFEIHYDVALFLDLHGPVLGLVKPRVESPLVLYLLQQPVLQHAHLLRLPLHVLLPLQLYLHAVPLLGLPLDLQDLLGLSARVVDLLEDARLFRLEQRDSVLKQLLLHLVLRLLLLDEVPRVGRRRVMQGQLGVGHAID